MMMYLWIAPGSDQSARRTASGVTDSASAARQAAEMLLCTGQARSALVECAYTAMAASALSLRYVRTGTGWSAHVSQTGQVVWTAFTSRLSRGRATALPMTWLAPEALPGGVAAPTR